MDQGVSIEDFKNRLREGLKEYDKLEKYIIEKWKTCKNLKAAIEKEGGTDCFYKLHADVPVSYDTFCDTVSDGGCCCGKCPVSFVCYY